MSEPYVDSTSILVASREAGLRNKLLRQIAKDYDRAGLELPISMDAGGFCPCDEEVVEQLVVSIYRLLMERFDAYMNLMYAADVRESSFREIEAGDPVAAAKEVVFIYLRRQWQKVWLRAKYDSGSAG